jgi:hypothetical protein
MNVMSSRILLLFAVVALALVSPAPTRAWRQEALTLKRVPSPSVWRSIKTEASADFERDGSPETLTLTDGRAVIQSQGQMRWQSPQSWRVAQAQIADLNRDGLPEVVLLVWRPFKPWPVDAWLPNGGRISSFHNSNGDSCHMILIGWKQGAFREVWAGSAMADPVNNFAATNLTGNGRQYLITLEGHYDDPPSAPARRLKVWEWNGFGFTVVNELESSFDLMVITQTEDGHVLILTN